MGLFVTYFVNHVGDEALDLIRINQVSTTAHADSSLELGDRNTCTPHGDRLAVLQLVESTGDKDFAQEISQGNVATSLQSQVYTSLHKLVLPLLQGQVERPEVASLDALRQRGEELLQAGVRLQKCLRRQDVTRKQPAGNEICEYPPERVSNKSPCRYGRLYCTPGCSLHFYGTAAKLR
jgi:hypothetical protein